MKPLSLERLIPGEKYLVIINWNEHNNLRFDKEYRIFGIFERLQFVRGRIVPTIQVCNYYYHQVEQMQFLMNEEGFQ